MALKVKISLETNDGGIIAANSIIRFETRFDEGGTECHYDMNFYRTLQHADNKSYIDGPIVGIPSKGYVYTLTEEDYDSLTPIVVHQKLKTYLESLPAIGTGNIEII